MNRRSGFTIVEIAVVISIVAILTTLIVVVFNQTQLDARDDRRTADITALKRALVQYYNDNGEYPGCTNPGFGCPISDIAPALQRYMVDVPLKDPKGTDYLYSPGTSPNQYGLLLNYEQPGTSCKTGLNMDPAWWWSVQDCKTIFPNRF